MRNRRSVRELHDQRRSGAMLLFVLALLIIIFAMVVYSVDVAFMQLARTELHAVTDAAAKAAAGELARTNGDHIQARKVGMEIAAANQVAGAPLILQNNDFEFGQAYEQSDGTWAFTPGALPFTSVRVTASKAANSKSGPVQLFFAPLFGQNTFTPTHVSVASQFEQELVLVIDRSHSMCFDESGVDWSYPDGSSGTAAYLAPPHSTGSRWAKLTGAIETFISTLGTVQYPPQVALVTWASSFSKKSFETKETGIIWNAVERDVSLGHAFTTIRDVIHQRGVNPMLGGTNLSAGIDAAAQLLNSKGSPDSRKSMIVMTDGQWNQGRDPIEAALDAKALGIAIHTITFLDKADQSTMKQVAIVAGGRHFHASNSTELNAIFKELALMLPVALTQ